MMTGNNIQLSSSAPLGPASTTPHTSSWLPPQVQVTPPIVFQPPTPTSSSYTGTGANRSIPRSKQSPVGQHWFKFGRSRVGQQVASASTRHDVATNGSRTQHSAPKPPQRCCASSSQPGLPCTAPNPTLGRAGTVNRPR